MRIILTLLVVLMFISVGLSQNVTPGAGLQQVLREVSKLTKDPDLKHGLVGFYLSNAQTGESLAEFNSETNLVPASSLKLLTTAAAFGLLGQDHRFVTTLEYDGVIDKDGVLNGNLFIRGGGDPTLGSSLFKGSDTVLLSFARAVHKLGIRKIKGAVIGDGSLFPPESPVPSGWIWGDIGNYYGTGSYGLNYSENAYTVYFNSGAAGEEAKIAKILPDIKDRTIINQVKSGGSGDNAFIYAAPYSDIIYMNGTVPPNRKNFDVSGSIPDPPYYCALHLLQELKRYDIDASKGAADLYVLNTEGQKFIAKRTLIASSYSPTLDKIIYWTNMKSHNMFAETLLRHLAVKAGKPGTVNDGIDELKKYFRSKNVEVGSLFIADGSGLSRSNSINARTQAEVLRTLMKEPWFEKYKSGLHVYHGSISAKSGYMNKARSYAGYVKGRTGSFVFSFIVNNYTCSASEMKEKMERVMRLLPEL